MPTSNEQLVGKVLSKHADWLWDHCLRLARRMEWAGNLEDVAGDLFQGAAERFLVAGREFLAQEARVSRERHERYALSQYALHAATELSRKHGPKRIERRVDAEQALEHRERAGGPPSPEDEAAAAERAVLVRQVFTYREGDNPRRHLAVLAVLQPRWVERVDFERVVGYRKGGARGLPRPVAESWRHFLGGRDSWIEADHTEWKRFVAELLLIEGPFRTAGRAAVLQAVNNLENLVKRALLDLRERALELGLDEDDV